MHSGRLLSLAAMTLLSIALVTAAPAAQSADTGTATRPDTQPHSANIHAAREGGLIATALAKVAGGRAAVHNGKPAEALKDIVEVRILLDLTGAMRPLAEVNGLLSYLQTHLGFGDNKQILAELPYLDSALARAPPSESIAQLREHLSAAKAALETPDRSQALKEFEAMLRVLAANNVDFSLQAAQEKLTDVIKAMSGDMSNPDGEALLSIEEDLLLALQTLSMG